jgi:SAM-dependent methyltransferase
MDVHHARFRTSLGDFRHWAGPAVTASLKQFCKETTMTPVPAIDRLRTHVGEATRAAVELSALGLALRARVQDIPLPPDVAQATRAVLADTGFADMPADTPASELAPVLALIRAELLFGARLLAADTGTRGWQDRDPEVLQVFGEVSHGFWRGFERLAQAVAPDLLLRLDQPGARFLDIGTGVAWLTIGMLQRFPKLTAVGIEPLAGALRLAQQNLAATGLTARMELRKGFGETLADVAAFDLIFVPSAFIPEAAVPRILDRARAALRPEGRLLLAALSPPDAESSALVGFRAAVWGGAVLGRDGARRMLSDAGFTRIEAMQQPGGYIAFLMAD